MDDKRKELYIFLNQKMEHHDNMFGEALDKSNTEAIARNSSASSAFYIVKAFMNHQDEKEQEGNKND